MGVSQLTPFVVSALLCTAAVVVVLASGTLSARIKSPEPPVWNTVTAHNEEAGTSNSSFLSVPSSSSSLPPCPVVSRRRSVPRGPPDAPHPDIPEGGRWNVHERAWRGHAVHRAVPGHGVEAMARTGHRLSRHVHILPGGLGTLERSLSRQKRSVPLEEETGAVDGERGLRSRYASVPSSGGCTCEPANIGVRWPAGPAQSYTLHTSNPLGLSTAQMQSNMEHARLSWACSGVIKGPPFLEGDPSKSPSLSSSPDGKNDVLFTDDFGSGEQILAMVVSWGYFDTAPYQLVESDMFFNSKLVNLAILACVSAHEWGHMHTLADVYGSACWDRTLMFGTIESSSTSQCPVLPSSEDRVALAAQGYVC